MGPERRDQSNEKIRSIAVLPFADLSAERNQEYFTDGIAEEILNALSKVGGLHVPARTSCFAFRGASIDARDIGKRLGVDTLLDGSIRKAHNRVRINVQLIDARNGIYSGRNVLIERLKTSSQFRTRLRAAYWSR
jgi:TolB-like protein